MKTTTLVVLIAVIVVVGGVGLYYSTGFAGPVTSPGQVASSVVSSVTSAVSGSHSGGASTGVVVIDGQTTTYASVNKNCNASSNQTGCLVAASAAPSVPQSEWGLYLGYIPSGYTIAPKADASITFPCPAGMTSSQCKTFQQTCGNGVCDPNETCESCPIDCTVPGDLSCDPYTGRASAPATVCQIGQAELNAAGGDEGGY